MKKVEVLFFDGCPNVEVATSRAREAIANMGGSADLHLVRVEGEDDALQRRFLGSPTIRVDGIDVEHSARARSGFGLQCRVYSVDGQLAGAPPITWIEAALGADASPTKVTGPERGDPACATGRYDATPSRVEEIAKALLEAGIGIRETTPDKTRIALAIYQELTKGSPIPATEFERLMGALGVPADLVRAAASQWLEFDPSGNLTGFGGLTLRPTTHALVLGGRRYYLWCALDGFLVAHALALPVCIETRCPATGTPIEVAASHHGVEHVQPSSAVMSVVVPASTGACCVADTRGGFCDFVNFYVSEQIAVDALKGGGATVLSMDQAFALGGLLTLPLRSRAPDPQ
jgi:alkylmercury lyase